jgi:hypothetical protein
VVRRQSLPQTEQRQLWSVCVAGLLEVVVPAFAKVD